MEEIKPKKKSLWGGWKMETLSLVIIILLLFTAYNYYYEMATCKRIQADPCVYCEGNSIIAGVAAEEAITDNLDNLTFSNATG